MALSQSVLPQSEGWLPYWLLFVSIVAFFNTVQSYTTLHFTSQVYLASTEASSSPGTKDHPPPNPQVTALSSRTFGTWTFLASIVRLYGCYRLGESAWYQIVVLTFVLAWAHFVSEWLVFETAKLGRGLYGPLITSTGTLVWLGLQYTWYVKE